MYDPYGRKQQPPPQLFEDTSGGDGYPYQDQRYSYGQYGVQGERYPQQFQPGQDQNTFGYLDYFSGAQYVQDPVANMAMQYGENLVGQGKKLIDNKIEKIVSVSKLKYYFAVDTKYVLKKLKLLFFPFIHSDWSIRYNSENDEPVQPRYDINAPDLYIPLMSFITYILMAGLCLGLQKSFSPDALGMLASWAIVWLLLELGIIMISFHIMAIPTKLQMFHVLAYISYKYVAMIACLLAGILMESFGYYCVLGYSAFSIVIFIFRTLRSQLHGSDSRQGYCVGAKRRFYILLLVSCLQPIMMWWLTRHLIVYGKPLSRSDPDTFGL